MGGVKETYGNDEEESMRNNNVKWYNQKSLDWYVKWGATILILVSVVFRNAGFDYRLFDLMFGTVGTVLWLWVSVLWKDRALIILNVCMTVLLTSALLKEFL
jgi:ABC-type siderophore export system fused ATPase/permease subunit